LRGEGRTIILTTHNLEEADRLCDRVAVLSSHLLALDAPQELRRKLFGRKVVFHLKEATQEQAAALKELDFVSESQVLDNKLLVSVDDPEVRNPHLIRILVEQGAEIQFVGELRRRLEDVYLELMEAAKGKQDE
jgi:ABC-2 type transport system ATP-binding protein